MMWSHFSGFILFKFDQQAGREMVNWFGGGFPWL
jgi:hypothetical protein